MDIFRAQFWYYCHLKQHEKQQLKQSQYSRCCERQMSKALMSYCLQDVIFGAVVEHAGHTGQAWCGKVSSDKWIPKLTVPLLHQPFQGKGEKPNSYVRAEPFPFFFPLLLSSCDICCDQGIVGLCIWCRLFSCGVSHIISAWSYCRVLPVFHTSSKHCACAKGRRAWEQLWRCTWHKSEGSSLRGLCGHPGSTAGHSNTAAIAGTISDIKGFLPCLQLPP